MTETLFQTLTQAFPCEFCKVFKNTLFNEKTTGWLFLVLSGWCGTLITSCELNVMNVKDYIETLVKSTPVWLTSISTVTCKCIPDSVKWLWWSFFKKIVTSHLLISSRQMSTRGLCHDSMWDKAMARWVSFFRILSLLICH